jgi:hypothetical protein
MRSLLVCATFALTFAPAAIAGPAAKLLGYDPEAPYVTECQTQQSTARLVTVALMRTRPLRDCMARPMRRARRATLR